MYEPGSFKASFLKSEKYLYNFFKVILKCYESLFLKMMYRSQNFIASIFREFLEVIFK